MADHARIKRILESVLGIPATRGNHVEVLRNGDEIFPAMLEAIANATYSVDLLTFIYWTGDVGQQFADALSEKAREGLRVRVLLDAMGAWELDKELVDSMSDAGCDVRWFRPVDKESALQANHRTHRKVLICDEAISFTGGVGIADEWSGDARDENEWRDTHFRIVGPATDGLRAAFLDNWAETGTDLIDQDVDRFPEHPTDGDIETMVVKGVAEAGNSDVWNLFRVLIECAEKRLRISTAYFTPDDVVVDLLCDAAERGVQVQVMVPGPHADKRFVQIAAESQYERLLDAGVETFSFQPSMLHAKIFTLDGNLAAVGSANFNKRSTEYDEEVVMVVFDDALAAELDRHYDDDLERCERIDASHWAERGLLQRAQEKAVNIVADLL